MKVSISWLQDYLPIQMPIDELTEALTMVGLEVETVVDRYHYLDTVLVGKIIDVQPHPNADRLTLCLVDIGSRQVSVVCGAPNVKTDMLAPLALPGTVLPDGNTLKKGTIRGQVSEGMLCSEIELALGSQKSGIMELEQNLRSGAKLAEALNLSDPVIEIDLTPNRPDCASVLGIAREIAAFQQSKINYPVTTITNTGNRIHDLASVKIENPDHCPRYAARLIEGIKVAPSPFWLQERLLSVGQRPINNIVDITNFVMLETGQPLHAFDFDRLAENRIVVRTAHKNETFVSLDEKERHLSDHMLMICDGEKPVAIGGVMGGLNSEIETDSTRVLIESAYFSPTSIRKTAKALGMGTDASYRFERGVDPQGTVKALNRATELMLEIGGGQLVEGLIDEHPAPVQTPTVHLSTAKTNRLLGTDLSRKQIKALLESIELSVSNNGSDELVVEPPSFRVDISRPEDLMEEVARLSGYNNIPPTFPHMAADTHAVTPIIALRQRVKELLTGFGFTETINYSFMDALACDRLSYPNDDQRRQTVAILNPLTEDQAVMRTSLAPGLLETMHRNISQQSRHLKLFEVGKIFVSNAPPKLPDESEIVAGCWSGKRFDGAWHSKESECDFYDLKGAVEGLLRGLHIQKAEFTALPAEACAYTKEGCSAKIMIGEQNLGILGEINPGTMRAFNLKQNVLFFEIDLQRLAEAVPTAIYYTAIPKFPATTRDATIIVDEKIEAARLFKNVKIIDEELVEDLYLFDVFMGEPVPVGKKSVSFRITYRSSKTTLEDETVNVLHKKLIDALIAEFNATLPSD